MIHQHPVGFTAEWKFGNLTINVLYYIHTKGIYWEDRYIYIYMYMHLGPHWFIKAFDTWYPSRPAQGIKNDGAQYCCDFPPSSNDNSSWLGRGRSSSKTLFCEVPQGSTLLPLLFNSYMKPLIQLIQWHKMKCTVFISTVMKAIYCILFTGQPRFFQDDFSVSGGYVSLYKQK